MNAYTVNVKRNARDTGEDLVVVAPNDAVARAYAERGYLARHHLNASVAVFATVAGTVRPFDPTEQDPT